MRYQVCKKESNQEVDSEVVVAVALVTGLEEAVVAGMVVDFLIRGMVGFPMVHRVGEVAAATEGGVGNLN